MKHKSHPVIIEPIESGPHRARVFCLKCQQWVKWAAESDYLLYNKYIKESIKFAHLGQALKRAQAAAIKNTTGEQK